MAQKGPNGESSYQNVKVDVAVDVANAVGGVTSVIARITLLEILDDNTVGENFKATVVGCFFDGFTVVDPLDLRRWRAVGLAPELGSLSVGTDEHFRLHHKIGCRKHLNVD